MTLEHFNFLAVSAEKQTKKLQFMSECATYFSVKPKSSSFYLKSTLV